MPLTIRRGLWLLLLFALAGCQRADSPAGARVADFLGGESTDGFATASPDRPLVFPADHGAHPDYQSEWWYFTGNLSGEDGGHFGFMFTIFRFALTPELPPRESDWGTNQAWMAHFGITDTDGEAFFKTERFARGAAGLAGAEAEPFAVWLYDWRAEALSPDAPFPLRLSVAEGEHAVDLRLTAVKPLVLQGEDGYSRKGEEPGNASHYYAYTRLQAEGTVTMGGVEHAVSGQAWMDREWSTSALGPGLAGWDWFAIQFEDGRDLMFYQLRRDDGTRGPWSQGAIIDADGARRPLDADRVELEPLGWWRSDETRRRYPVRWRLSVPDEGLDLTVSARLPHQEMTLNVAYWEGAVIAEGAQGERGVGYLEMTGY